MFYVGDILETLKKLPSESVHCCVTSPPYWGLRDYGVEGQLGLEKTLEEYVDKFVKVFREVRRILRSDGTLWLNLGDCYWGSGSKHDKGKETCPQPKREKRKADLNSDEKQGFAWFASSLKPKDVVGIPWMIAFALRADGWYLRSDIIWAKPNAMPESVRDRPTKAHEYVFLLTKNERYFYDADAIRQAYASGSFDRYRYEFRNDVPSSIVTKNPAIGAGKIEPNPLGRNKRSVWIIPTEPFPEAHFATFPPALVEPCIKAGTSEYGCCPQCGAPWERMTEYRRPPNAKPRKLTESWNIGTGLSPHTGYRGTPIVGFKGWRPTCYCGIKKLFRVLFLILLVVLAQYQW